MKIAAFLAVIIAGLGFIATVIFNSPMLAIKGIILAGGTFMVVGGVILGLESLGEW